MTTASCVEISFSSEKPFEDRRFFVVQVSALFHGQTAAEKKHGKINNITQRCEKKNYQYPW